MGVATNEWKINCLFSLFLFVCFLLVFCLFVFCIKGALHVLLISPILTVFTHDWAVMKDTLPAIVQVRAPNLVQDSNHSGFLFSTLALQADHSEKPSIQKLMNKLAADIVQKYEYFSLQSLVR